MSVPAIIAVVVVCSFLLQQQQQQPASAYVVKSKFNKLRYITLKDDAYCEAYQEFRENSCVAKLTMCSPLTDDQLLKMRQVLCGPRFNPELQPPPHIRPPEPEVNNITDPHLIIDYPEYFLDVHPAQPHSFPWLAAIYNPARQFICTGALVSPKTVITSAQCVSGQSPAGGEGPPPAGAEAPAPESEQQVATSGFFVRFGRHHLNISSPYDKAYEYDVETIEISQQFDRITLENDFAILKLVSPVCNFPPVLLPKKDDWENGHFFGNKAPVVYAGWGLGQYQQPYLRSLTSHLVPKDLCAKEFNWPQEQMSNNHLCVTPPINVCVGGSGTPLVAYTPHKCVLIGLMSLGDHCNTHKMPLLFSKVSPFIDEINRFIDEDMKTLNGTAMFEQCFQYPKEEHFHQPYYYYPSHYTHPDSYHQKKLY